MPDTSKKITPEQEKVALPSPPLNDPNTIRIRIEETTEHIQKVTAPKISKELPKIYEARHYQDEKGITHVEILSPSEDLLPSLTLTIEPDGYAEIRRMGYLDQDYSIRDHNPYKPDIVDHIRNRLFNRLIEELGAQTISTIAASDMFNVLYHRLHTAASDLVTRLTIPMPETDIPFDHRAQDPDHPQDATVTAKNTMYNLLSKEEPQSRTPYYYVVKAKDHNQKLKVSRPNRETVAPRTDPQAYTDYIFKEAAKLAEAEAPEWNPIRHRRQGEDGASTIEVMYNDGNPPIYTIRKLNDGSVDVQPISNHKPNFNFNETHPATSAIEQAAEFIIRNVLEIHPNPAAAITCDNYRGYEILHARDIKDPKQHLITAGDNAARTKHLAREIVNRKLRPPDLPESPRTKDTTINSLPKLVTRTVRKSIVTPGQATFSRQYSKRTSGGRNTTHYNIIAVNQPVIDQIPPSSQSAVSYFKTVVVPLYNQMIRFQHPGQIIKAVQHHLDLEPELWRWFLSTGDSIQYQDDLNENRVIARIQAILMRDANQTDAHPARIAQVIGHQYDTRNIRFVPIESNDLWSAWVRAVSLYLGKDGPPTYEENANLTHIGDAIRQQANQLQPQPWPHETWEQMVQRADRLTTRQADNSLSNNLTWESALNVVELDGFSFIPATTSSELFQWGQVMKNCVGSYDTVCRDRGNRIFIAHSPNGKPLATIELEHQQGTWQPRQIEGHARSRVSKELQIATAKLAQEYQRQSNKRKNNGKVKTAAASPFPAQALA